MKYHLKKFLFVFTVTSMWLSYARSDENITKIICPLKCDPPPVVDGNLGSWFRLPGGVEIVRKMISKGKGTLKDDYDFGGTVWFCWDRNYLYFAADIIDDVFRTKLKSSATPSGDGIEIQLLSGKELKYTIKLLPGNLLEKNEEGYIPYSGVMFSPDKPGEKKLETVAVPTEDGYAIEVRIPWKSLQWQSPKQGLVINARIIVRDADKDHNIDHLASFPQDNRNVLKIILSDTMGKNE